MLEDKWSKPCRETTHRQHKPEQLVTVNGFSMVAELQVGLFTRRKSALSERRNDRAEQSDLSTVGRLDAGRPLHLRGPRFLKRSQMS